MQSAADPQDQAGIERDLALVYYQTGQFDQAERTYLKVLDVSPEDVTTLNNLSFLYSNELNKPDRALPYAKKAIERAPFNSDVLDTYGWTLAKLGQYDQAEIFLARAVQLGQASPMVRYHLGWTYEQIGRLGDSQRQYQSGLDILRNRPDEQAELLLKEAIERVLGRLQG